MMALRPAREALAVGGLLTALVVQLAIAVRSDGLTNDEVLYVAAGYRHLTAADYRVNPTTPPLAKLLSATGLLGLSLVSRAWTKGEDPLDWAYRFVNVENDPAVLLPRARLPGATLTVLLALLVWWWARLVARAAAGLLALALFTFHPSLLAHGHLATTDVPTAAFMLAASFAFWKWSSAEGPARKRKGIWIWVAALAVGAAAATRLTGWLLLPSLGVVAVLEARRRHIALRVHRRTLMGAALAMTLAPVLVVWACYQFQRAPWPGAAVYETASPRGGPAGRLLAPVQRLGIFPEAYLEGARFQIEHGRMGHPGYLLGQSSRVGWWWYFALAFLVKNTPGFLIALVVALALAWRHRSTTGIPAAHWLVPALAVFGLASAGRVQIGERYILAVYPYLIVWAATVLARAPARRGWPSARVKGRLPTCRGILAVASALALILHVGPALAVLPRGYLTYFNVLGGGPEGGHRLLLDSNLDWGQDLPRLAAWMRAQRLARVQLAYHGADDPDRYGIVHEDLPGVHLFPERKAAHPFAGVVAVSPNLLWGLVPRLDPFYAGLRDRPPDDRAGVFFIYRLGGQEE